MAVYTHVGEDDLRRLLDDFDIGELISFAGVEQGVENTNYFLTTTGGRFILTLFEKRVAEKDLPFFMAAMAHLARGAPAPKPAPDRKGAIFKTVCGRPAVIISFLEGRQRMTPSPDECRSVGDLNARLHLAADGFALRRDNNLSLEGWKALAGGCAAGADSCAPGLGDLIADEISFLSAAWPKDLPFGLVHADLFPDNVFFHDGRISGVIDFYFACTDYFAYDLSITTNAWASRGGRWSEPHAKALIEGYDSVRPLSPSERAAMPTLLRGASIRILLTRLHDWLHQVDGALVAVKDPLEYRDLLEFHRNGGSKALFGN
ncbi:MAG: homoserine kinase [Pseudomonadota bacterium]